MVGGNILGRRESFGKRMVGRYERVWGSLGLECLEGIVLGASAGGLGSYGQKLQRDRNWLEDDY